MTSKKNILFIVNPISGTQGKEAIVKWIEKLTDCSKYNYRICRTQHAGHAYELAGEAAKKGIDIVVAIGGDGTINEVGRALIHTQTALGIIPCGSGNGLARHLGIPMDVRKAIQLINEGYSECIDYGKIDGHPFSRYVSGPLLPEFANFRLTKASNPTPQVQKNGCPSIFP